MIKRLITLQTLFITLLGFLFLFYTLRGMWVTMETDEIKQFQTSAAIYEHQLGQVLQEKATILSWLSKQVNVQAPLTRTADVALDEAKAELDDFQQVWVASNHWQVNDDAEREPIQQWTSEQWYVPSTATADEHLLLSRPYKDEQSGIWLISASLPVYKQGKLVGYVGGDLLVSKLQHIIDSYLHRFAEQQLTVFSDDGFPIYQPTGRTITPNAAHQLWNEYKIKRQTFIERHNGYYIIKKIPHSKWIVMTYLPTSVVEKKIFPIFRQIIVLFLLCYTMLMVVTWFILHTRLKYVPTFARKLHEVASGNFHTPFNVPKKLDELTEMAEAIVDLDKQVATYVKEIETIAYTDALTGVANRLAFLEQMERWIETNEPFHVMYIDLDDFKLVNDTQGHAAGDEYLCYVSQMMLTCFPTGLVARLGGDEFVILSHRDLAAFRQKTTTLVDKLQQPFTIGDCPYTCRFSAGVVQYPEDGTTVEALLNVADDHMYKAKQRGKGYVYFKD